MSYVVLVAWLVQAAVGVLLLTGWLRHGRIHSRVIVTHVTLSVLGVACWITYVLSDRVLWAWVALLLITIGNGFGDNILLRRTRAMGGSHLSTVNAYRLALRSIRAMTRNPRASSATLSTVPIRAAARCCQ